MVDVHQLLDRYVAALNKRDWAALREIFTPDYYEDWPQSGERVVGVENFSRIFDNYPGSASGPLSSRILAGGERWVLTPQFTTIRVTGSEDRFTAVFRARYPDDQIWYVVSIVELRHGLMASATRFWAPTYTAPEWRSAWVEPLPPEEA
jgi:hypothetical protein